MASTSVSGPNFGKLSLACFVRLAETAETEYDEDQ